MTMANPSHLSGDNSNSPGEHNNNNNPALILRRLPPSLSIDSAQSATNRPLTIQEQDSLNLLNRLKEFLATAPTRWSPPDAPGTVPFPNPQKHPALNRFSLPSGEYVTCVLWQGLYHITGTDIVRALVFRFEAFGRPVRNMKKFEEGIFSDLRNLKPGSDACLEEPKSPFLDLLYKYQCIRTQKKQKVFFWFSVPHDRLFLDALERDLKREKIGLEAATGLTGEPALSYKYDGTSGKSLWEEWMAKVKQTKEETQRSQEEPSAPSGPTNLAATSGMGVINGVISGADRLMQSVASEYGNGSTSSPASTSSAGMTDMAVDGSNHQQFWGGMLELFEGSPSYKQRRKKRTTGQSSRLSSKDKDRGRGVRKSSKDPEDERDVSAGVSVPLGAALSSACDNGVRRRMSAQGEIEMARRELQESLGRSASGVPIRTDSPSSMNAVESRSSTSSPEQISNHSASSTENAPFVPQSHQVRSLSFGAVPAPTQMTSQLHSSAPGSRGTYHPYNRNAHPPPQPRHTLPILPPQGRSVARTTRPPGIHVLPHHATTLPAGIPSNRACSLANRPIAPANTHSPSSVAFVCPLQTCGRLFSEAGQWNQHVTQHVADGSIQGLSADTIHQCRVEIGPKAPPGENSNDNPSRLQRPRDVHPGPPRAPIKVEAAQFAHAPPGTPEPSPYLSAHPGSLAVSPAYWTGTTSRPTSSGFASSPGSVYSGPPSSHSPSPPQEALVPPPSRQGSGPVQMDVPPRSPAFSLQVPSHQAQQQQQQARSAPSYKQNFDHGALYPQGYAQSPMSGSISRPRSAVPEMYRGAGGAISRPTTAMSYHDPNDYFPPAETAGVAYGNYSPASATTSSFSVADALPPTPSHPTPATVPAIYHNDSQYHNQMSDIIHLDAMGEPVGGRRDSLDHHSSPEMEAAGRYTPSSHLNPTIPDQQQVVVREYPVAEYHMDSPPEIWTATSYHPSPESHTESVSPPTMQNVTHVPAVVDINTGMTTEEAIQLFAES